jgi:hypothetical protein
VGAEGETAFGVWLYGTAPGDGWGLTLNTYSGPPDFPPRTEVRARGTARYGREPADLKIHRGEEHGEMSARIYVLVLPVGERGEHTWRLRGWLWGHEAQEHWLRRHGGREEAYFCPQTALHDMDTYPDRLHDQGVGVDERVAEYLADCAAAPWLERKYHPTAAGAVKLIYHRGPGEAAAIKAAFEAQS